MSEKKIAVVTGGARGIGKAIALELAKAGNLVVINYNGSEEKARETKAEIEAAGGQADILQCNVADFDACEAFFKAVAEKYGRVDILVNNAGVTKDGLLMKMSEEDFSRVVDINLKGTFNCIRHVCFDKSRCNGVDRDPSGCQLLCSRFCKTDDPGFGCRIIGLSCISTKAYHR